MKAVCTKNSKHDQFVTTAHVMEEWLVDSTGDFISVKQSLQTVHRPDPGNQWTCAVCGSNATVTI